MAQQAITLQTTYFDHDGRGPSLEFWLRDRDLYLPDSEYGFAPWNGDIVGVQYALPKPLEAAPGRGAWVVFDGLQVIQIVPEEVHSYWHLDNLPPDQRHTGVWRIEKSDWCASFQQRHLTAHHHYLLEFYDEIVEVICRDLIFGADDFMIATALDFDDRFAQAYLRYAESQEKRGNSMIAVDYFQRYIDTTRDEDSRAYARRRLEHLQRK